MEWGLQSKISTGCRTKIFEPMDIYDYKNCWYCDNIVAHPEFVGLLYLDFPRCFILVRNKDEYFGARDYDTFMANSVVEVNWLDPNDRVSDEERENVLIKLLNFSVNQEEEEERRYSRGDYDDDIFE